MPKLTRGDFKFKRHERVGAEDAEHDDEYLIDCFLDNGDLDVLRDSKNLKRIVLGRTGSGKTALLTKLRDDQDHAIFLNPEALSLQYISSSTILKFLSNLGVNLDLFYKTLWKHIFVVELIKERYHVEDEETKKNAFQMLRYAFIKDRKKEKAIEYLEKWGDTFWEETEYRVRELTTKFESDIKTSIGAKFPVVEVQAGGDSRSQLSSEERTEFVARAQEVISKIQVGELNEVVQLLIDHVFADTASSYYILIDRLDEDWVEDDFRPRLIKGLLETVKDFVKIKNVKIIVALRRDLVDRVFRLARSAGLQEEKFEALYLRLSWSGDQLMKLIDKRVSKLVRRQYTLEPVTWRDLLPSHVRNVPIQEYLVRRTLLRPRDIINFFNCCVELAVDRPDVSLDILKGAESRYSALRLNSLATEWQVDYPELLMFARLLEKRPASFKLSELHDNEVGEKCLEVTMGKTSSRGCLTELATDVAHGVLDFAPFKAELMSVFYRVGLVGLKIRSYSQTIWSFIDRAIVGVEDINDETTVSICPVFYSTLGIVEKT